MSESLVPTTLGRMYVRSVGEAEKSAILWHSMLVDHTQWDRVITELSAHRRLIVIDGPGHGRSGRPPAGFTLADCADTAVQVLDRFEIDSADWVGNAWGGHVGLVHARRHRSRCRSLVTVGTPTSPLPARERVQVAGLYAAYRVVGARPELSEPTADVLLSAGSRHSDPAARNIVTSGFRRADRVGMYRAMRAMMTRRPELDSTLPDIDVPTLVLTGSGDHMWPAEEAARCAAALQYGRSGVIEGAHRLPPLERPDSFAREVTRFWVNGTSPSQNGVEHADADLR